MNPLIINIATGGYKKGADRLRKTLFEKNFCGDILFFDNESDVGSPSHIENPYAFKTHTFQYGLNLGYTKILWLDASVYAIKDINIVWDILDNIGYLMQYAGWTCGQWANDNSLDYFNITRDDAMNMKMYGNAGLLGLNFENETSKEFFNRWHKASIDGIFKGKWNNNEKTESNDERCLGHRHDMSTGSIIANQLGMNENFIPHDEILQYASPEDEVLNETIIFKAQGIN